MKSSTFKIMTVFVIATLWIFLLPPYADVSYAKELKDLKKEDIIEIADTSINIAEYLFELISVMGLTASEIFQKLSSMFDISVITDKIQKTGLSVTGFAAGNDNNTTQEDNTIECGVGQKKCGDDGNAYGCSNYKWVIDEECPWGCDKKENDCYRKMPESYRACEDSCFKGSRYPTIYHGTCSEKKPYSVNETGIDYVRAIGEAGEHQCASQQQCWCIGTDLVSKGDFIVKPNAVIQGTDILPYTDDPDRIKDPPLGTGNPVCKNPTLEIRNLDISPKTAKQGEQITISGEAVEISEPKCEGVSYECRQTKDAGCELKEYDWKVCMEYKGCNDNWEELDSDGDWCKSTVMSAILQVVMVIVLIILTVILCVVTLGTACPEAVGTTMIIYGSAGAVAGAAIGAAAGGSKGMVTGAQIGGAIGSMAGGYTAGAEAVAPSATEQASAETLMSISESAATAGETAASMGDVTIAEAFQTLAQTTAAQAAAILPTAGEVMGAGLAGAAAGGVVSAIAAGTSDIASEALAEEPDPDCYQICNKDYAPKNLQNKEYCAAKPKCDKGGYVIKSNDCNYECTPGKCGNYANGELHVDIIDSSGNVVDSKELKTDSRGKIDYTINAPDFEDVFKVVVTAGANNE